MPKLSVVPVENGLPEMVKNEQISLSLRKLARLRANLKALRSEISDRLFVGVKDCRKYVNNTIDAVGEINAAVTAQNK